MPPLIGNITQPCLSNRITIFFFLTLSCFIWIFCNLKFRNLSVGAGVRFFESVSIGRGAAGDDAHSAAWAERIFGLLREPYRQVSAAAFSFDSPVCFATEILMRFPHFLPISMPLRLWVESGEGAGAWRIILVTNFLIIFLLNLLSCQIWKTSFLAVFGLFLELHHLLPPIIRKSIIHLLPLFFSILHFAAFADVYKFCYLFGK